MITITDTITGQTATIEYFEAADTLRAWNPEAPSDVLAAIDELQEQINRKEYLAAATFLAVEVQL